MKGYLVVIEWDGQKVPNPFYHRVHKLAGKVRGDKEVGPISRRTVETAVIMQEGAIWAADESLARTIGLLAQKYGAMSVSVGEVFGMDAIIADDRDLEAMVRVERVCGRRGRPPAGEPENWHVVCYMESTARKISRVEHEPLNCKKCGSMVIQSMPYNGAHTTVKTMSESATIFEHWVHSRFSVKNIFFPLLYTPTIQHIQPVNYLDRPNMRVSRLATVFDKEQFDIVERMNNSNMSLLDVFIDEYSIVGNAMSILDGIFVGQYKMREEDITKNRIAAIAQVIQEHGAYDFNLIRSDDQLDIFDAAAVRGVEFISKMFGYFKSDPDKLKSSGLLVKN